MARREYFNKVLGSKLFSDDLKKKILKESGLPVSYALASNKLTSKVATNKVKPNGSIRKSNLY